MTFLFTVSVVLFALYLFLTTLADIWSLALEIGSGMAILLAIMASATAVFTTLALLSVAYLTMARLYYRIRMLRKQLQGRAPPPQGGGKVEKIVLKAVDDEVLVKVLKRYGVYDDVVNGRSTCYVCGRRIQEIDGIGGMFMDKTGRLNLVCNNIACLYRATWITRELQEASMERGGSRSPERRD
jgi:membrane protein implicated in regulation of membrane protease activity